jgi:hypothetical protein
MSKSVKKLNFKLKYLKSKKSLRFLGIKNSMQRDFLLKKQKISGHKKKKYQREKIKYEDGNGKYRGWKVKLRKKQRKV